MTGGAWLSCRGVVKRYGGVTALSGVDLDVQAGTVLGLIGPNGAGKSTLAKILAGAVAPDEGTITVDDTEIHLHDPADAQHRGLVMMPQEIAVVPDATVADNITLGVEPSRRGLLDGGANRREAQIALDAVGLEVDPGALAGELPPPYQRMLMMARAIHRRARLLILDEPTAGLAEHEASMVVEAVRRTLGHDLSVIYVSHHLSEVAALADRVVCVRESRIAGDLLGEQVTRNALVEMMLGVEPGAVEDPIEAMPAGASEVRYELEAVCGRRLDHVSLQAGPGRVVGVTGLLGSGVAELVSIVVGAARPTEGVIRLDGAEISMSSPADALGLGVGYLPGDRGRSAFLELPIRENVSLPALGRWFGRIGLISRRRERREVASCLSTLSVAGDAERPISALSGGNQQRALVARLLATQAQVIVLDEPTVGVDIQARAELWNAVRQLATERTIIVASSDPEELCFIADLVVCIKQGRVAEVIERRDLTVRTITNAIA